MNQFSRRYTVLGQQKQLAQGQQQARKEKMYNISKVFGEGYEWLFWSILNIGFVGGALTLYHMMFHGPGKSRVMAAMPQLYG